MKNKLISIIILITVIFSTVSLVGCGDRNIVDFEDEYFQYYTIDSFDFKAVGISGLTEEGKKQEILVIPSIINGYYVIRIGRDFSPLYDVEGIKSNVLKKIFIPKSCSDIRTSLYCEELNCIILLGEEIHDKLLNNKQFFSENVFIEQGLDKWDYKYFRANIEFRLNYKEGKEDIFWLDNEPADSLITKWYEGYYSPEREGYSFAGWYKETECINAWNFETDKTPTEILDEETNEPILQITKLYAKWETK